MPTYSYECKKCGHVHDVFHAMNAKPRVKCEACGGSCRRLLGIGSGIIFKGSGFYETDYKRKDGRGTTRDKSSEKKEPSESKPAAKSETKSESKPSASSGKEA